jgi:hypothetical protein
MRTRARITLAGLAFGATLASGVAWATAPSDDSTIQGCKAKKNGALRVVAGPADCSKNEQSISWNQHGPQGEAGADGAAGKDGAKGEPGPTGASGTDGKDGADGADGSDGAKGEPGSAGARGETGVKGDPGVRGADGQPGAPGQNGQPGGQGPPGPQGPQGAAGPATDSMLGNVTVPACGSAGGCWFYGSPEGTSVAELRSNSVGIPPEAYRFAVSSPSVATTASALAVTLSQNPAPGLYLSVSLTPLAPGPGVFCTVSSATTVCSGDAALPPGTPFVLNVTTSQSSPELNIAFGWMLG